MAKYNDSFKFTPSDIAIIERALREQISQLVHQDFPTDWAQKGDHDQEVQKLREVLGKLNRQKTWYSQVHQSGVPLG